MRSTDRPPRRPPPSPVCMRASRECFETVNHAKAPAPTARRPLAMRHRCLTRWMLCPLAPRVPSAPKRAPNDASAARQQPRCADAASFSASACAWAWSGSHACGRAQRRWAATAAPAGLSSASRPCQLRTAPHLREVLLHVRHPCKCASTFVLEEFPAGVMAGFPLVSCCRLPDRQGLEIGRVRTGVCSASHPVVARAFRARCGPPAQAHIPCSRRSAEAVRRWKHQPGSLGSRNVDAEVGASWTESRQRTCRAGLAFQPLFSGSCPT